MGANWLIEDGIGEERALLVENGQALAAAVRWPGELEAGLIEDALLVAKPRTSPRGRARFASGEEALVDRLPPSASEGARLRLQVTRSRMGEGRRVKLAQARPTQAEPRPAPTLAERTGGRLVRRFPAGLWEDVLDDAREGLVTFAGGSLILTPTPAMTLVDVDGTLPPRALALAAIDPLAAAIARMGLGGVIGIDFPTLQARDDRKAVDVNLEAALADFDHERTAMNGFGFVQLVARLERPSLLHRAAFDPAGFAARALLRQAEMLDGGGRIELAAHPAVLARIGADWQAELARRSGRQVVLREAAGLAISGGHAQLIAI
ncbi:ribonuclease [Alteraurantiacibacter palmitatis]|uniref:Ribonuclease n=1 Tax=Alteraurantiacibacter palmitatis TaxID=2054628 RepID=A0ABV7E6B7_9SPHN